MKYIIIILAAAFLTGCDAPKYTDSTYPNRTETVDVYRVANTNYQSNASTPDNNEWIYWYLLLNHNTYYYSCYPVLLSDNNYSKLSWQSSKTPPEPVEEEINQKIEPISKEIVPENDLGEQVDKEIDTTEEQINAMNNEGNPNNQEPAESSSSENSESSSSESSSSDSGSSGD